MSKRNLTQAFYDTDEYELLEEIDISDVQPKRSRFGGESATDLTNFKQELQAAARLALPSDTARYGRGAILSITWKNCDFQVDPMRMDLLKVLKTDYGFDTEVHEIDSASGASVTNQLSHAITGFRFKYGATGEWPNLLLFYYSGHAFAGTSSSANSLREIYFYARSDKNGRPEKPFIKWNNQANNMIGSGSDTPVAILDCCHAALANLGTKIEVMAASSWGEQAPINSRDFFSKSLVAAFELFAGKRVTASQIMSHIMKSANKNHSKNAMPVYRPSHSFSIAPAVFYNFKPSPAGIPTTPTAMYALVTITVHLTDKSTTLDLGEWKRWLLSEMPPGIRDITIDAAWESKSTVVVVTLPFELWCHLPLGNPDYQFVAHVQARLSLEPKPSSAVTTGASDMPSGRENQRPGGGAAGGASSGAGKSSAAPTSGSSGSPRAFGTPRRPENR